MCSHAFQLTSYEERIAREDDLLVPILHEPADAVLRVARRMQRCDCDVLADLEGLVMLWYPGHGLAVFPSNYGNIGKL